MNIQQRLSKIEKQFAGVDGCGHILVRYSDDGSSGEERAPEPEPEPCCPIARPWVLRVVYEAPRRDEHF